MRLAQHPRRRRILTAAGLVVGVVVIVAAFRLAQPWWDAASGLGIDETITNDTGHAITWSCGDAKRTMAPGATDTLSFAISPEDDDGCYSAGDIELCVNEFQPDPGQHVTASAAITEWACR